MTSSIDDYEKTKRNTEKSELSFSDAVDKTMAQAKTW